MQFFIIHIAIGKQVCLRLFQWSWFVEKLPGYLVTRSVEAIPMNFHDLLELTALYAEPGYTFQDFILVLVTWNRLLLKAKRALK